MAPELLQDKVENIDEKVDIWAVGVLTHYLLTGEYPFKGDDFWEVKENIIANNVQLEKDKLSPIILQFINICIAPKSEDRQTAEQLVRSNIFNCAMSLASDYKMFQTQANILNYMATNLF